MPIKILSDIVDVVSEHISNPGTSGFEIFVGLEHYDSGDPLITRYGSTNNLASSVKHFVSGDILVARRNVYLRRAGVVRFEGVTSGDSIVLRVKDKEYSDILPFILNSDDFWDYAEQNSDGTMSKRLAPDVLLEYECNIPDNHYQIANKLWAAYRLKESYKRLLAATDEMVKSQFIEMTTRSELNKKSIGEIAEVRTGSTPSRSNPEYWNGTHYWVSAQDMGNKYIYDTLEKITDKGYATCKVVPAGSILYVCRGSIGVMSINTMDCATNQSICTATCKTGYNTEYLYYALKVAEKAIKKQGIGTSFKSLNQSAFASIEILFPAIEIQDKFATIAKQADKSKYYN